MDFFIEVDHRQLNKKSNLSCGDFFISRRFEQEGRIIAVLADGLGSGIKASVLSTLTATMALNFVANDIDIVTVSRIIMETLPVCQERKIGYSTFTIVDIADSGQVRIIEYDNPKALLSRHGTFANIERKQVWLKAQDGRQISVHYADFKLQLSDRLIFFTDGVTQAGMGSPRFPMGWGDANVKQFIQYLIDGHQELSAGDLAQQLVGRSRFIDGGEACDDISAAVVYMRHPRQCHIFTGPPVEKEMDAELANLFTSAKGTKIICGGSTSQILARELKRDVEVILSSGSTEVPPISKMEGADLITEGTITLTRVASILEFIAYFNEVPKDAAEQMVSLLLTSDTIEFIVGLSVNLAHQNPGVAWDLELRKNVVKKIVQLLQHKFLKSVTVRYL